MMSNTQELFLGLLILLAIYYLREIDMKLDALVKVQAVQEQIE